MSLTEAPPAALSVAMRVGSQAEHEAAESSTFMAELLDGRVNELGYATYLTMYRDVYAALEEAIQAAVASAAIAAVHDPRLIRLAAIDADLAYWKGRVGGVVVVSSPATDAYVARIREIADDSALLAAHHYTRYLGDLSGGQAIGRILDRTFLLDGAGIAFYDFAEIAKPKIFRDGYRAGLDALDLSTEERDAVVEEVRTAFRLNRDMFAELGEKLSEFHR